MAPSSLKTVLNAPNADIDIVFIHGLHGNHYKTWYTHSTNEFMWSSLLPSALTGIGCRIMSFVYPETEITFTSTTGTLTDIATNLTTLLSYARHTCQHRPIIFICHDLGGTLLKLVSHIDLLI